MHQLRQPARGVDLGVQRFIKHFLGNFGRIESSNQKEIYVMLLAFICEYFKKFAVFVLS